MKNWHKKIEEGRCQGFGKDYVPFFKANEDRSWGTAAAIYDPFEGRQVHTMSTTETSFYYQIRWDPELLHIREQFLLDIDLVNVIRGEFGLQKVASYYTTDFLLDYTDGTQRAYSIKYSEREFDPDSRQYRGREDKYQSMLLRQNIEKIYWESQGVDFSIVTHEDINIILSSNVQSIMPYYLSFKAVQEHQKLMFLVARRIVNIPLDIVKINFWELSRQVPFDIEDLFKKVTAGNSYDILHLELPDSMSVKKAIPVLGEMK